MSCHLCITSNEFHKTILFSFCILACRRTILLSNGIEKLIRKAKGSHQNCKDAATAALRDLGLDDYNA